MAMKIKIRCDRCSRVTDKWLTIMSGRYKGKKLCSKCSVETMKIRERA